ncbi:Ankyrin repeat domain-containing protein 23 [Talaromyces pinophilus]|nr:Ankyrin repeat domain-containing protein 23 [Talaromyces pinophilus]
MFQRNAPEDLIKAIKKGDLPVVQGYLDNGVHPNARHLNDEQYQRRPLLSYAALHGHTQMMELLIKHGADVDKRDLNGRTPLSWATEYCQFKAAKLLIDHGAKINAEDDEWGTPLSWLIDAGSKGDMAHQLRHYLISQGAKENLHHTFWDRINYSIGANWHWIGYKLRVRNPNLLSPKAC